MAYDENRLPVTVVAAARRQDAGTIIIKRWAGCWIDLIALAVGLVATYFFFGLVKLDLVGGFLALIFLLGYFPVTEGLWGQSLGKLIMGLVVVDEKGDRPGLLRAAGRTLTRLVEVNPLLLGGIPAGITVALNDKRQRLGDMLAGTYVISKADWKRLPRGVADAAVFD
jgi:uncharacterized RDD family membrane protein YckC